MDYDRASQSSDNLISKGQINNVLRNLNVSKHLSYNSFQLREGLFSEEDIQQLEHGYSVSDTDEERNGGLLSAHGEGDLLSLKSDLSFVTKRVELGQRHGPSQSNMQSNNLMEQVRS